MGIIKRADLESYTRQAVPMDLGDLQRRGDTIVKASQDQAASILKDANLERDRLIKDASEQGHAKGYEEGFAKGNAEGLEQGTQEAREEHSEQIRSMLEQWTETLDLWESDRKELMIAARTEVIQLAAHIASRVIKRTIDLDPEVVVDQLEAVLDTLVTPTDIRVRVHPADIDLLGRVMPGMIDRCASCNHADLVEDDTLAPGSCVIGTKGGGTIDASIARQLDRIVATLLPAHRGPDYDDHLEDIEDSTVEDPTGKPESGTQSKDDAA